MSEGDLGGRIPAPCTHAQLFMKLFNTTTASICHSQYSFSLVLIFLIKLLSVRPK